MWFTSVAEHAKSFADYLKSRVSTIHAVLRKYESKKVVDDEIERTGGGLSRCFCQFRSYKRTRFLEVRFFVDTVGQKKLSNQSGLDEQICSWDTYTESNFTLCVLRFTLTNPMRIGIDAHIILPKHKRYDPAIARYTEALITHLLEADKKKEHTWVLFFDQRMQGTAKMKQFEKFFARRFGKDWAKHVVIKHFPFVQYRQYLPVVYSQMLISGFLTGARLDLFHSPEGLIPYVYPGRIVTTFHYVPRGASESNLFVRTFMMGARVAFAQLCRRASRIIVDSHSDRKILAERHGYSQDKIIVMETSDLDQVDWPLRVKELMKVYKTVVAGGGKKKTKTTA